MHGLELVLTLLSPEKIPEIFDQRDPWSNRVPLLDFHVSYAQFVQILASIRSPLHCSKFFDPMGIYGVS